MDPEPVSFLISLLIRTLIFLDQGPTLTISFNQKYFLTTKIVILGVRAPIYELSGTGEIIYIQSIKIPMKKFAILWNLGKLFTQSVQFSYSVVSDSLRPHGRQHTKPPCPSPIPRAYSNSCPSSQ